MSAAKPKPFQIATIRHVSEALRAKGSSRRFLVADEVGLGKTLVAQGVIQDLMRRMKHRRRPPCVLYVCSNLTIARQNYDTLIDFLPGERPDRLPDRLSMLARDDLGETEGLTLYALTPYTSTGSGGGRADERALLANALELLRLRSGIDGRYSHHIIERLSLSVGSERFKRLRERDINQVKDLRVLRPFRSYLCRLLGSSGHAHTTTLLEQLKSKFELHPTRGVETLRRAMALATLEVISPDLIILDEFQRFAEMLLEEDAPEELDDAADEATEVNAVMRAILGAGGPVRGRPDVLMLSATPYRLFSRARDGQQHHEGFFALMRFLVNDDAEKLAQMKANFSAYRECLASAPPGDKSLIEVRDRLEASLLAVMCRTERAASTSGRGEPLVPELSLIADDIKVFRQLAEASRDMPSCAEPYWSSIPYPLQAMDAQYVLRADLDEQGAAARKTAAPQLSQESVRSYQEIRYAHPRLRGLLDVVSSSVRELPWLPPTLPWWDLSQPFSTAGAASKALVFSHFRATPRILAAIASYEAERHAYSRGSVRYDYRLRTRSETRRLNPDDTSVGSSTTRLHHQPRPAFSMARGEGRLGTNLATLVHFAPLLAGAVDPLELAVESRHRKEALTFAGARKRARQRILELIGRRAQPKANNQLDWVRIGRWIATIESGADEERWDRIVGSLDEWASRHADRRGAAEACRHVAQLEPFADHETPTTLELDVLAELALASPGAALCRAWERVFGRARKGHLQHRLVHLITAGLSELAPYLDTPEWHVSLRPSDFGSHAGRRSFADVVRSAVWSGNFESVLDELLATFVRYDRPSRDEEDDAFKRLGRALTLRDASVVIRRTVNSGPSGSVRMRCHAAAPLGLSSREISDDNDALRTDNLRVAFNSPFRPMMLVTTSIGQEGLDFHQYASRVVHWDLPSDPVELEQRDGRLMRFGSLAVRRALAEPILRGATPIESWRSPWLAVGAAGRKAESPDGMSPWWVSDGAAIERVLLVPPFSGQRDEFNELEDLVALYRLALGQPNQEHLLRILRTRIDDGSEAERQRLREWYREAGLRLSPWKRLTPGRRSLLRSQ